MSATTQRPMPQKATVTMLGEREFRVERIFNAPRERVWRAMTEPALVAQWWGRGNQLDIERMDFVRGGHWRYVEHAHGEAHGFEGRYREIKPPELIESTFEWDGAPGHVCVNRITLEDLGDGRTRIVGINTFMTAEDRDGMTSSGMEAGMNASYEALDRLLERLG